MKRLHAIVLGLLIVALLPWGAFLSSRTPVLQARQEVQVPPASVQPAGGPCRIAVLPGQTCGHDLAVLPVVVPLPEPGRRGALHADAAPLPRGVVPATAVPPPRLRA